MKITGQTVLITGGATGIGLGLAEALVREGNRVLVCGRREVRLREAQAKVPALQIKVGDVSKPDDCQALAAWAVALGVNVLVNNAGIQRLIDLREGVAALEAGDNEIRTNFEGPLYLTAALMPHLLTRPDAAIINVSSSLAFAPIAAMPVYCATKAAVHAWTAALRHQLRSTRIRVFEVIPPTVDTELDRGARAKRGQLDRGIPVRQAVAEILVGLQLDHPEIAIAGAAHLVNATPQERTQLFERMNPTASYSASTWQSTQGR